MHLLDDVLALPVHTLHRVFIDDVGQIAFPNVLHLLLKLLSDTNDSLDGTKSKVKFDDASLLHEDVGK